MATGNPFFSFDTRDKKASVWNIAFLSAVTAAVSALILIMDFDKAGIAAAVILDIYFLAVIVLRTIAKSAGREVVYQEARKGKDRIKGKEGRAFSVELLVGILIPIVFMAIEMIMRVVK